MNYPNIDLRTISRDDVKRIVEWIKDDEVAELWFGRYSYGDAAHLGYDPQKILTSSKEEWDRTFNDENPEPHRAFFSIYKSENNLQTCAVWQLHYSVYCLCSGYS